ncbi:MAG: outer membrane beta-barrel protein [Paraglaciecola sp.]|uniref:outer membrane beta-barrel protein n=1 Tax=Paraglaciecola sp. TaxID=1920173 RepID=UPI00329A3F14
MDVLNRLLTKVILSLTAIASTGITAQENSFTVYTQASVTYEDNLFKIDDSLELTNTVLEGRRLSDSITSIDTGAEFGYTLSKQRFTLNAFIGKDQYSQNSQYDNDNEIFNATWNWYATKIISGALQFQQDERLANFTDNFQAAVLASQIKNKKYQLTTDIKLHSRLNAKVTVSKHETRYSNENLASNDKDNRYVQLAIVYKSYAQNTLSINASRQQVDYLNRLFQIGDTIDNEYLLSTIGLSSSYQYSGTTHLSFRLAWEKLEPKNISTQSIWDFSNIGYNFSYNWTPSPKLRVKFLLTNEVSPSENVNANFQRSKKAGVTSNWQVLTKTYLTLELTKENRELELNPQTNNIIGATSENAYENANIGLVYEANSNLDLKLAYQFSSRRSDRAANDFDSNTTYATLVVTF